MECGAPTLVLRSPDSPTMSFDDRLTNRQADAHPLFLGRDERLEEPAHDFRRQSRSSIGHNEFHEIRVYARCLDGEFTSRRTLHRFYAVADEVEQHLPHLNLVDQNRWNLRIKVLVNLDPRICRAHKTEGERLFDKIVQVLLGPRRFPFFDEFT
jgi:hypothetical protein